MWEKRTARLLPLQGTVDASRGKVGVHSSVTDCSVSTEARACPELIFTRPHWDSQKKQGGERGKHRGLAEYSKKLSGANTRTLRRGQGFFITFLS